MIQLAIPTTDTNVSLADSGEEWAALLEHLRSCGSSGALASLTLLESVWCE